MAMKMTVSSVSRRALHGQRLRPRIPRDASEITKERATGTIIKARRSNDRTISPEDMGASRSRRMKNMVSKR